MFRVSESEKIPLIATYVYLEYFTYRILILIVIFIPLLIISLLLFNFLHILYEIFEVVFIREYFELQICFTVTSKVI